MPITPLVQFEEDVAQAEREAYEKLSAPKTIVVRFGLMKLIGEFPYKGDAVPGCGSKMVVRTVRGVELGEMLTTVCTNSGCAKSVSREEMLGYIENSGGRDYPFFEGGKVLRIASKKDLDDQARLDQSRHELKTQARSVAAGMKLDMKIVEAEPLLDGDRIVYYYMSEARVEHRELARELSRVTKTRVDMRQVGARDEARLTADYEKCGQYCCCKGFLKVLKPVSMRSAKIQKATLDPLKISGRCGRLMCCLRYEDQTYDELRKKLPHRKSLVGTPEGDGMVVSTQILTQLAMVRLDATDKNVAFPIEDLTEPTGLPAPKPAGATMSAAQAPQMKKKIQGQGGAGNAKKGRAARGGRGEPAKPVKPGVVRNAATEGLAKEGSGVGAGAGAGTDEKKRKRRRRRGKSVKKESVRFDPVVREPGSGETNGGDTSEPATPKGKDPSGPGQDGPRQDGQGQARKRKRRRRRGKSGGGGGGSGESPNRPGPPEAS